MSPRTKIVILRMKEIVYTVIFIGFAIFLVSLFLIMFRPRKDAVLSSADASAHAPGVYTASLALGSQNMNVKVTVDVGHINSVALSPLNDSMVTTYPLMQPVFEDLVKQMCAIRSTESLSYPTETRHTSATPVNAIEQALHKTGIKDTQQKIHLSTPASRIILHLAAGCNIVLMEL